jgi:predicted RNase H-like HicB family nuclease
MYDYSVVIRPDDNGTYVAYVPAIPGCHAIGSTPEEAKAELDVFVMIQEAHGGGMELDRSFLISPSSARREGGRGDVWPRDTVLAAVNHTSLGVVVGSSRRTRRNAARRVLLTLGRYKVFLFEAEA